MSLEEVPHPLGSKDKSQLQYLVEQLVDSRDQLVEGCRRLLFLALVLKCRSMLLSQDLQVQRPSPLLSSPI